jgi:ribosomal protein L2
VDLNRRINCYGQVLKIIKLAYYSSFIGFIVYTNGLTSYIILSDNMNEEKVYSGTFGSKVPLAPGSALPIQYLKLFSLVHNIEMYPFCGSQLGRAAGVSAFITKQEQESCSLKLRSG